MTFEEQYRRLLGPDVGVALDDTAVRIAAGAVVAGIEELPLHAYGAFILGFAGIDAGVLGPTDTTSYEFGAFCYRQRAGADKGAGSAGGAP